MNWSRARFAIWIGIGFSALYALPMFEAAIAIFGDNMGHTSPEQNSEAGNSFLIRVANSGGELFSLESTVQPILIAFTIPALWLRSNFAPLAVLLGVLASALIATYYVYGYFSDPENLGNLVQMSSAASSLAWETEAAAKPAIMGYISDTWESFLAILFLVLGVEAARVVENNVEAGLG